MYYIALPLLATAVSIAAVSAEKEKGIFPWPFFRSPSVVCVIHEGTPDHHEVRSAARSSTRSLTLGFSSMCGELIIHTNISWIKISFVREVKAWTYCSPFIYNSAMSRRQSRSPSKQPDLPGDQNPGISFEAGNHFWGSCTYDSIPRHLLESPIL